MKKAYMKPQTEVFKMEASNMICGSMSGSMGGSTPSKPGKAPFMQDWDEDLDVEEMTNFDNITTGFDINSLLF